MEIRALRAFVAVVREGGFSAAAKVVHSTQSTVSKTVRQLERELGVDLLDRVGQRNVLTGSGQMVYDRSLALLTLHDELLAEIGDVRHLKGGVLRVGFLPMDAIEYATLFAAFRKEYPHVGIQFAEHKAVRLQEMLLAGELDLAAAVFPVPPQFDSQALKASPLLALLPAPHPEAKKHKTTLAHLKTSPFILFSDGFAINDLILSACAQRGISPKVVAGTGNIDFMIQLVAGGVGVAFLPDFCADKHQHPSINQVPLDEPGTELRRAFIWRRGGYLSHAARAWLALAEN